MTEDYRFIRKTADMPENTDFCFIMDTDLMAPVIKKGDTIYVCRSMAPEEMEAGVFLYEGQIYCRQYCEDYAGSMHLLCANPGRESENLRLGKEEKEKCLCLGKVLLKEKPPMPLYI